MRSIIRSVVAFAMFSAGAAFAQGYSVGSISIDHPWSRATVAGIPNGAAYFVLKNNGDADDRLLSASSPVANKAELHTHLKDGEVMRMRQVDDVVVPAGGSATFEPGGLHVMLMGLKAPLEQGSSFPLTLVFDKAGSVSVDVTVDRMGGTKDAHGHDQHH